MAISELGSSDMMSLVENERCVCTTCTYGYRNAADGANLSGEKEEKADEHDCTEAVNTSSRKVNIEVEGERKEKKREETPK